jgi:hypothetical protein
MAMLWQGFYALLTDCHPTVNSPAFPHRHPSQRPGIEQIEHCFVPDFRLGS